MEVIVGRLFPDGDDDGGEGDEEELDRVGGDEDPAAAGGEVAVEAAEEEGSDAEGYDGDAGAHPARVGFWLGDSEADVDGVAWSRVSERRRCGWE